MVACLQARGAPLTDAGVNSDGELGPQDYTVLLAPPKEEDTRKLCEGAQRLGVKLRLRKKKEVWGGCEGWYCRSWHCLSLSKSTLISN